MAVEENQAQFYTIPVNTKNQNETHAFVIDLLNGAQTMVYSDFLGDVPVIYLIEYVKRTLVVLEYNGTSVDYLGHINYGLKMESE